jgi:hypothetical protein
MIDAAALVVKKMRARASKAAAACAKVKLGVKGEHPGMCMRRVTRDPVREAMARQADWHEVSDRQRTNGRK